MTGKQMAKKLRSIKGRVFVDVHNAHDVFMVQCVKSDLIMLMENMENSECGFVVENRNGEFYFGKDYNYV